MNGGLKRAVTALLATTMFCASSQGQAQDSQGPSEVAESEGLADIVVTAQKRSENIQRVPIAITALSSDQLGSQHVTNINAVGAQVPSLSVTSPYADTIPLFSLRGISTLDVSQNQSTPVAIYVDEVYKGLGVLTALQVFDVERVEVLRGPQGTLYGKNTTGGAVNFYSAKPDPREPVTGYISLGIGNYDRVESNGAISVPVVKDVLGVRAAFTYAKQQGFVRNLIGPDQNSVNDLAGRLSLVFRPSDKLRFDFRYTQSRSRPTGYGILAHDIQPGGIAGTGYTRDGLGFFENESSPAGFQRIKNKSAALTTVWSVLDGVDLTAVTALDRGTWLIEEDTDATPMNLIQSNYSSKARAFQQDIRLASTGHGDYKWLVGAYYYRDRVIPTVDLRFFYSFAGDADGNGQLDCFDDGFTGCRYSNEFKQVRTSYAFYTQQSYAFTDRLSVVAGLRYTRDLLKVDYYRSYVGFLDPSTGDDVREFAPIITAPPAGSERTANRNLSGKIGLNFQATPDILVYASASRGYRGAAVNGQGIFSPDEVTLAAPERLDAFELGLKTQLLEDKLRINGAVFYYDYRNQQYLNTDTATGAPLQVLYNAPRSRIWGAEVEILARPVPSLDIRLGGSYLNSKYLEATLLGQSVRGNQLIIAPKWTANGAIDWRAVEDQPVTLTLHADVRYTSRQFYDAFNNPLISQRAYAIANASFVVGLAESGIKLTGWIKNLANVKYRVVDIGLAGFGYNLAQRGRPREFGITATYDF